MTDVVDSATRSKMMSGIRGSNTKPELLVRSLLHRNGFRFRLHVRELAGKPDILLPKYRAAIFVNGCFWHGHDCHLFKWPRTKEKFWSEKIISNRMRDQQNLMHLQQQGWRTMTIWECALKGKYHLSHAELLEQISKWLHNSTINQEIEGKET